MYFEKIPLYTQSLNSPIDKNSLLQLVYEQDYYNGSDQMGLPFKYEKDFWLTVILGIMSQKFPEVVFKGGTCLNKVYYPQFRMSEDLDFVYNNIYNLNTNSRDVRSNILNECFEKLQTFMVDLGFVFANKKDENGKQRFKHNESRNGIFIYEYESVIDGSIQTIKIDIIVGPEILKPLVLWSVTSAFNCFNSIQMSCYDIIEMLAEKMKAALCRKGPAIRDYYDIWYAYSIAGFDFSTNEYMELLIQKLKSDNFLYTFNQPWAYENLLKQIEKDLYPVLLEGSDTNFSLEDSYIFVSNFCLTPNIEM